MCLAFITRPDKTMAVYALLSELQQFKTHQLQGGFGVMAHRTKTSRRNVARVQTFEELHEYGCHSHLNPTGFPMRPVALVLSDRLALGAAVITGYTFLFARAPSVSFLLRVNLAGVGHTRELALVRVMQTRERTCIATAMFDVVGMFERVRHNGCNA